MFSRVDSLPKIDSFMSCLGIIYSKYIDILKINLNVISYDKNIMVKKNATPEKYHKVTIPKAVREQCWLHVFGKKYEHTCYIPWCKNVISVFDFHVGHDLPESKGGTLDISNLKPICARCNQSMSNNYSIQEWVKLTRSQKKITCCFLPQSPE